MGLCIVMYDAFIIFSTSRPTSIVDFRLKISDVSFYHAFVCISASFLPEITEYTVITEYTLMSWYHYDM